MDLIRAVIRSLPLFSLLILSGSLVVPRAATAQYKYPRDDLIVIMNGAVFNVIDHLGGTAYYAYYNNNGAVCSTPFLSLALEAFGDKRVSEYDLLDATEKTTIAVGAVAHLEASQCISSTIKF